MTTLFEETLVLASRAGVVKEGTATGGDDTYLQDTALKDTKLAGGTVWIKSGPLSGNTRRVISNPLNKLTFASLLDCSDTIEAGDRYAVINADYPLEMLRRAINMALRELAPYEDEDLSLVTVAGQEEYDLPDGVENLTKVEIAQNQEAPYDYYEHRHYAEGNGVLRFVSKFAPAEDDYPMRLTYIDEHTDLTDDSDLIPRGVNLKVLRWSATASLCREALRIYKADPDRQLPDLMNEAQAKLGVLLPQQKRARRHARLADW